MTDSKEEIFNKITLILMGETVELNLSYGVRTFEISAVDDEYTYTVTKKSRSPQYVMRTSDEIKTWKTMKGAKRHAIKNFMRFI